IGSIFFTFILMQILCVKSHKWLGWIILGLAIGVDFTALMAYSKFDYPYNVNVTPTRLSPCYTHQAVLPDYQNPKILPFREYFNVQSNFTSPSIYDFLEMYGAS